MSSKKKIFNTSRLPSAKNDESDDEYEEEEATILVELNGMIDSDILNQPSFDRFKILGIDSDQPILQLNNYVFRGEFSETVGTALIFKEGKRSESIDSTFSQVPAERLKYVDSTFKSLNMKRIFVSEINENDGNNPTSLNTCPAASEKSKS